VKFEGIIYGKSASGHDITHVTRNQERPFMHGPMATTICGLPVYDYHRKYFTRNKVCKTCLKLALDAGMKIQYRLPEDVGEEES
jgi:hypothetical protein